MLSRFFIDRPIFAWVVAIVIMLAGAMAIRQLPLEQYPNIAPTTISINATYNGASAKTIEDSVTQIIEQRLMTRANLSLLADRIGLYKNIDPPMTEGARVSDIVKRITFIGFTPDVTRQPGSPGATILGISFDGPTPEYANKGANELVKLVLEENQRLRRENAELRKANEVLKAASVFFAKELDRP